MKIDVIYFIISIPLEIIICWLCYIYGYSKGKNRAIKKLKKILK